MGKIKGWKKEADGVWVHKNKKKSVQISYRVEEKYGTLIEGWTIYLYLYDEYGRFIKQVGRSKPYSTYERALKYAKDYMKKHPRG